MKHATITAVLFLLAITQGSAEFQCPVATFVELGKGVVIDCLISDVNDIYWLRGTEEDHYPIVKIEMGRKTISKVAQDHFDITDTGALVIRDASNDLTGSYVMLHYRTDLVREVDTVTLNVTTLVDSIIIQGPSGGVYPMGSNITLTCTFQKGYVVGWKEYENKDIFVADTKVTADTKYDNFRVSLSDRISNLQIIGAELEDAGKYSCNTESYAHVEIEAPPTLRIICNVTDDEDTYSPESHDVIDITCTARNAKPAVMIRFKTDGNEWINPSETWTVSKGITFDTSATLKYNVRKNQNDGFLTCQAFGQKTVPPMEKTIHLFTPTCDLHVNTIEASCNCTSNPPVYKYILSIDGKMEVGKTLNVENLVGSTIICTGVNYIGVGTSKASIVESNTGSSFLVYVIIIVCSVVVILGFVIVVIRLCKKNKCCCNCARSSETDDFVTTSYSKIEPAPPPVYGEIKKDRKKKSDKPEDYGAGPGKDPEIPAYGVIDKKKVRDPTPAPRSSMRDSTNSSKPKQDGPMEMQYADLDHGNKPPSDEVRKPKEEPAEYATVQSVIV